MIRPLAKWVIHSTGSGPGIARIVTSEEIFTELRTWAARAKPPLLP
jgi:hypothetical protein